MTLRVQDDSDGIQVGADGVTLLRYRPRTDASKPYVERLALPPAAGERAGRNLVVAAPHDHAWHLGLFFCQKLVDGINCWESEREARDDRLHGRASGSACEVTVEGGAARIEQEVVWSTDAGDTLLEETRRIRLTEPGRVGPAGGYLLEWETILRAAGHERRLGSETLHGHYSGLSARFSRELEGGAISLPDGEQGADEANGSDAAWCDYTGALDGAVATLDVPKAGVTTFDDPANPRGSRWFTMTEPFGFVAANPTWGEVVTLHPGEPFSFRWGCWVHDGDPSTDTIERVYDEFKDGAGDP